MSFSPSRRNEDNVGTGYNEDDIHIVKRRLEKKLQEIEILEKQKVEYQEALKYYKKKSDTFKQQFLSLTEKLKNYAMQNNNLQQENDKLRMELQQLKLANASAAQSVPELPATPQVVPVTLSRTPVGTRKGKEQTITRAPSSNQFEGLPVSPVVTLQSVPEPSSPRFESRYKRVTAQTKPSVPTLTTARATIPHASSVTTSSASSSSSTTSPSDPNADYLLALKLQMEEQRKAFAIQQSFRNDYRSHGNSGSVSSGNDIDFLLAQQLQQEAEQLDSRNVQERAREITRAFRSIPAPIAAPIRPRAALSGFGGQVSEDASYEELLRLDENNVKVGVDRAILQALPVTVLTAKHIEKLADQNCSVCLSNYSPGDKRKILPCLHGFHDECVDRWLMEHKSCPLCFKEVTMS